MINKTHRLTRSEIDVIKLSPSKVRLKGLLLLYKTNEEGYLKASVVVSKKISPLAVKRNKYKREVVFEILKLLPKYSRSGLSIIFYPSKDFLRLSSDDKNETISKAIDLCLKK